MWVGLRIQEDCYVRVPCRSGGSAGCGLAVINQCIHWVMVAGMLFWNQLPVVVVGNDV
jgi:hypothetical protein